MLGLFRKLRIPSLNNQYNGKYEFFFFMAHVCFLAVFGYRGVRPNSTHDRGLWSVALVVWDQRPPKTKPFWMLSFLSVDLPSWFISQFSQLIDDPKKIINMCIYIYIWYIYIYTHGNFFGNSATCIYIWKFKPWYGSFAPFPVQAAAKVLEADSWQRFVQQEMCPGEPSFVVATQRGCIPAKMSSSKDISCNKNEFVMCSMCRKFIAPQTTTLW